MRIFIKTRASIAPKSLTSGEKTTNEPAKSTTAGDNPTGLSDYPGYSLTLYEDMPEYSDKKSPSRSKGLLTDIYYFLLHKPKQATQIKFETVEERTDYNLRMMQRVGIDPNHYSVLNIHKIGVEAPVSYIFNELLQWNGDSTCWPNHIAKVNRIENDLERIQIHPFGWKKYPFRFMKSFFGFKMIPLFI